MQQLTTQVLIIGAGPTGLMAANQLMRFGIDFIIVDGKSGPTNESRAILVTARSMEIYEQMELSSAVVERGKKIESLHILNRGKERAELKIGEIGKGLSDFSYMLAFEQSKNEELLYQNLQKKGKQVFWKHEFIELKEHTTRIEAVVKNGDETMLVNAQYLIACDGARSKVRHQLNFSFKGGTYQHKFFVADTKLWWKQPYNKLILCPGDHNFCGFIPLYGNESYRVLGTLPREISKREDISFADLEKVIKNNYRNELEFKEVNWFSVYHLHHRAVSHFSEGRVFLAGDSAHIHSPAGGQGMNTGLQDAYNLCWKLAMVLNNQAKPQLLNSYNEERLPFAKWLINFTDRMFSTMTSENWFVRFVRKYIAMPLAGWALSSQRMKRRAFKTASQIWFNYNKSSLSENNSKQSLKFKAGDRLPYLPEENIYSKFISASFHLLHIGEKEMDAETHKKITTLFPFAVKTVECRLNEAWKKLGVTHELFVLVRPDNYLAYISDDLDEAKIQLYIKRNFV